MASISSLSGSSSSSSSIYGNRTYNIISGLASGLDTESLISGAIQGYQQKIQNLQNQSTKLQWQQEAYQSISDKLVEFYRNYASFAYSNSNLASASFFNSAVTTTANGTFANLVTASGKTDSTVVLNAVKNLASAARYTHTANGLNSNATVDPDSNTITTTGDKMSNLLTEEVDLSKLSGSLTLNYGDRTVSIDFGERELYTKEDGSFDSAKFQSAIVSKLKEQQISTSDGSVVTADTLINVTVDEQGNIGFSDKSSGGNTVSIADATGNLKSMIRDYDQVVSEDTSNFSLDLTNGLTEKKSMAEYLSGKSITVALDGKSKTIELPKVEVVMGSDGKADVDATNAKFTDALNEELKKAFGDRIEVSMTSINEDGSTGYGLSFKLKEAGSTLSVTSSNTDVANVLGIGTGLTSYVDTTKTLGDLNLSGLDWSKGEIVMGVGSATQKRDGKGNLVYDAQGNPVYVDQEGNLVNKDNQRLGQDGEVLRSYDVVINGVTIGSYHRDTELNTVINAINSNTEAGVNVSYSKTTGQFVFTAKDTGAGGRVEINETIPVEGGSAKQNLGAVLFGAVDPSTIGDNDPNYTHGQDAEFIATINGQVMELTRSSNSFDLDGMNITVSGTFNEDAYTVKGQDGKTSVMVEKDGEAVAAESVSFTSKTDADKIVEVVKKMVEDLNALIKEVKSAYSDMPLQKTDGSSYEPLTDEDKEGMSESAIEAYEEKAKTGILFMDRDLSSLYNDLRNAITSSGSDGVTLRSMGIETAYSDGLTTLTFDEQKFREALESDPDKVQEAFTKSKENGAATNGFMASLTAITDKYADTDGDVKGILIEKAGSKYSPSAALDNDMLDQLKEIEEQISKWQDKMSNQVDYYTNKFTQLELLMNQMNSQSSALSGLMGG